MFDCSQIARLVAKSKTGKLRFRERVELFVHVAMCRPCRVFSRVQAMLDRCAGRGANHHFEHSDETWNDEQKRRVADAVSAEVEKSDS